MDSDLDESLHDFESTNIDKFKLKNFIQNKSNSIEFEDDSYNNTLEVSKTCLNDNKIKKSSIFISNNHAFVKSLTIDCGKTTLCHINQITSVEPDNLVKRGGHLVKFSSKSKSVPYDAKILASNSKGQFTKIQILYDEGSKTDSKNKNYKDKPIKIRMKEKIEFLNKKNSELQAVVDHKNIEIANLKRDYQLMEEKYNTLYNSFSKFSLV